MATPKDTNDHFPQKTRILQILTIFPRNSPDKNLFGHITAKSIDLTQIVQISRIFRF